MELASSNGLGDNVDEVLLAEDGIGGVSHEIEGVVDWSGHVEQLGDSVSARAAGAVPVELQGHRCNWRRLLQGKRIANKE